MAHADSLHAIPSLYCLLVLAWCSCSVFVAALLWLDYCGMCVQQECKLKHEAFLTSLGRLALGPTFPQAVST